jgi:hypothetical protein
VNYVSASIRVEQESVSCVRRQRNTSQPADRIDFTGGNNFSGKPDGSDRSSGKGEREKRAAVGSGVSEQKNRRRAGETRPGSTGIFRLRAYGCAVVILFHLHTGGIEWSEVSKLAKTGWTGRFLASLCLFNCVLWSLVGRLVQACHSGDCNREQTRHVVMGGCEISGREGRGW